MTTETVETAAEAALPPAESQAPEDAGSPVESTKAPQVESPSWETFDEYRTHFIDKDERAKAALEAHLQERDTSSYKRAYESYEPQYQALNQEIANVKATHAQVTKDIQDSRNDLRRFQGELRKAAEAAGYGDPDQFHNLLEERGPDIARAWDRWTNAVNALTEPIINKSAESAKQDGFNTGAWQALADLGAETARMHNKPEVAQAIEEAVNQGRQGKLPAAKVHHAVIEGLVSLGEERGYKKGLAASNKAVQEGANLEKRNGAGPDLTTGGRASGRPTIQQYAAATSEQRATWREQGIEPVV